MGVEDLPDDAPPSAVLIRGVRSARGISQKGLEEATGLSDQDIGRADRGELSPKTTADKVLALMEVLEIPAGVMRQALRGERSAVDAYLDGLSPPSGGDPLGPILPGAAPSAGRRREAG